MSPTNSSSESRGYVYIYGFQGITINDVRSSLNNLLEINLQAQPEESSVVFVFTEQGVHYMLHSNSQNHPSHDQEYSDYSILFHIMLAQENSNELTQNIINEFPSNVTPLSGINLDASISNRPLLNWQNNQWE